MNNTCVRILYGRSLSAVTVAAVFACAAPLAAQDQSDGEIANSSMIDTLAKCTEIEVAQERLACFDREVGTLVGAANQGEVRVVETEEITDARKRLFGFSLPKVGLFRDGNGEEVDRLQSTVTRVRKVGRNEWHFWIEEGGAKWRIKNNSIRARAPKVGDKVEFRPASMGTYWIRVNGRKGVRGNRIG